MVSYSELKRNLGSIKPVKVSYDYLLLIKSINDREGLSNRRDKKQILVKLIGMYFYIMDNDLKEEYSKEFNILYMLLNEQLK